MHCCPSFMLLPKVLVQTWYLHLLLRRLQKYLNQGFTTTTLILYVELIQTYFLLLMLCLIWCKYNSNKNRSMKTLWMMKYNVKLKIACRAFYQYYKRIFHVYVLLIIIGCRELFETRQFLQIYLVFVMGINIFVLESMNCCMSVDRDPQQTS